MVGTSLYIVSHMAILQYMYEAVQKCPRDATFAKIHWDSAAALMIGSIKYVRDSSNTVLTIYNFANKMCDYFNVCHDTNAKVNEEIKVLLFAGRSEIKVGKCDALEKTARSIEYKLIIPLIQGSLYYTIQNSNLDGTTSSESLSDAYIFSRAVLPYVNDVDVTKAEIINKNSEFQPGSVDKSVPDGYGAVFDAFRDAIPKIEGVNCRLVGYVQNENVCETRIVVKSSARTFYHKSVCLCIVFNIFLTSFRAMM